MKPDGAYPNEAMNVRDLLEGISASLMLLVTGMHRLEAAIEKDDLQLPAERDRGWRVAVELGGLSTALGIACGHVDRCQALLRSRSESRD
jgi:hypothetical protein